MSIFTLDNLFRAYKDCREGKKNTVNAILFELEREKNLLRLLDELSGRTYEISRSIYFVVTNPVARQIFAADFRDRVVHHLLCGQIQKIFEEDFIAESYANRKGKGTHLAVRQAGNYLRQVSHKTRGGGWCLKLDIQSFFPSIDREILFGLVEAKLRGHAEKAGGGGVR